LGYEWSAAKGDEGIKLIRDSIGRHQTLLYDEGRRDNAAKINQLIAENFSGNRIDFTEELAAVCSYTRLVDLLAFGRPAMDKALGLDAKSTPFAVVDSSMRPLSEVAFIEKGVTYTKPDQVGSETTNVVLTADNVTLDGRLRVVKRVYLRDDLSLPVSKQLREGDIFICMSSGSREHVGKVSYVEKSEGFFAGGLHGHPACKAWGQLASSL
jgi:type I restriction enzyme M protein